MRWMRDDWKESLLALAKADIPGRDWQGYPNPEQRHPGSYSIAAVEETEMSESWVAFVVSVKDPGAREAATWLRSETDTVALRGKIAALEEEQDRLREQLRRIEGKLDEFLATPGEVDTVPVDPHTRWIQENLETLRQYPGEWIALHLVRGILFHTADGDQFAGMLDGLSADERDEVLAFHSSMYI